TLAIVGICCAKSASVLNFGYKKILFLGNTYKYEPAISCKVSFAISLAFNVVMRKNDALQSHTTKAKITSKAAPTIEASAIRRFLRRAFILDCGSETRAIKPLYLSFYFLLSSHVRAQ